VSRRVFVESLTEKQARDGVSPTVVRVEGRGEEKTLRLPGDEYLSRRESLRLARWILSRFKLRKPS
jgi:hypothetical protein